MDYQFFIFKLKHLKGIGNKGLLKILQHQLEHPEKELSYYDYLKFGNVQKQYEWLFKESFALIQNITRDDFDYFKNRLSMITIMDKDYSPLLKEIYNPPIALFYLGDIELLSGKKPLAMIGSRKATAEGKQMIDSLMPKLVKQDVTIVSGLAKGNDTFSHQAAIRHHGKTIAVIGCGLDICYPRENERLQQFIGKEHLLLSEYLPNTRPLKHHFPSRNRIIAGIARGTCVIEAKKKSGTFITAQLALEEGRDVFAVPGSPLKEESEGCLHLIQEGAKCVFCAEDILEEWF